MLSLSINWGDEDVSEIVRDFATGVKHARYGDIKANMALSKKTTLHVKSQYPQADPDEVIDKYIGDGLMVFFGDPESKGPEKDAERCLEMALDMQRLMRELTEYWGKNYSLKKDLQIRIGINTGFCTVGNFGSLERLDYTAIGSTVNLAARLEALAGPGSILVSEDTHSLVQNLFVFGQPKEVKIKGFLRQIKCFELNQADYSKADILQMTGKGFEVKINRNLTDKNAIEELQVELNKVKKAFNSKQKD